MIRKAKRDFYQDSLNTNSHDSKSLWQGLKSTFKDGANVGPKLTKKDGIDSYCPKDIADSLNEHFVNIASEYIFLRTTPTTILTSLRIM